MGRNQGDLLYKVRFRAQYTQADMARILGVKDPQFVSNIERGISSIPFERIKKLFALAPKAMWLNAILADVREQFNEETK